MGIIFAFIIAFAESLPLIGTIIPGSVTMTVIGILVGRGMIPGFSTLVWATIGALAGDTIGFALGKYYNERLRTIWPFRKHPKWLTMGEAFFKKHGGKSILIGRFIGPARSSVPLIAGLLKMRWGRFFIAAVPSAISWAIVYMLPGALIGAISLELPKGMTTKFILIGLVVIVPILAIIGLSLSQVNPRQGRFFKMLPAIILLITYLGLLIWGRTALEKQIIPLQYGMWWVHGLFGLIALYTFMMFNQVFARKAAKLPTTNGGSNA